MNIPPPPPGFQIEAAPAPRPAPASAGSLPPPPPGFQLEQGDGLNPSDPTMRSLSRKSQFANYDPSKRQRYQAALERVRQSQFPDMSDEEWAHYSDQFFAPDIKAQADQSQAFGFSDELSAAVGGLGSQVRQWTGGGGPGYGESYGDLYELEQARLELARQENGALGTAAEIVSGAAMLGPGRTAAGGLPALAVGPTMPAAVQSGGRLVQAAKAAVPLAAEGGIYGFGATDGDLGERAKGAATGAAISVAAGAAAPLVAKVAQGVGRRIAQVPVNMANRQAMRQAVKSAPAAAAIKGTSQAAYKAAERTGAEIGPQAMQILSHDMTELARLNGLIMPSGKLSTAYPKVAHALRSIREFAQGPVSIEQAQTLLKSIRAAQKSIDPDEARLGMQMANAFEDFLDGLPPSAFSKNGQRAGEAVQQWAVGRTEWARAKRTQAIENIIADARLAKGGFASGLRSGFASMLKSNNAKKRRGFSKADLDAIERFVEGGPIQELLERIGGGAGLPGGVLGGITGGPVGAVAVPAAGMGARRLTNRNARQAAQNLRAQVAIPGGVPMRALPPPMPLPLPVGLRRIGGVTGTRTGD
jgi:hypothetical protein